MLQTSEHVHDVGRGIQVVVFTLVMNRGKVDEDAERLLRQSHIVPQLLTLGGGKCVHSLAFHDDGIPTEEIDIMTMLKGMTVEIDTEIVLLLIRDVLLSKDDG